MVNERLLLLRAVLANPSDDTPRLVFADWLQENAQSDADTARVEFLRLWYRLKPSLRSTTRTIAGWLKENVWRLWPTVRVAAADQDRNSLRVQGRTLALGLNWESYGQPLGCGIKVYFDRGFVESIKFGQRNGYERFSPGFALDEPLAQLEPGFGLGESGVFPNTTSVVTRGLWGPAVFGRLTGFDSQPSPDEKVYATRPSGTTIHGPRYSTSDEVGRRAITDAMTALAREATGLFSPPPEPA